MISNIIYPKILLIEDIEDVSKVVCDRMSDNGIETYFYHVDISNGIESICEDIVTIINNNYFEHVISDRSFRVVEKINDSFFSKSPSILIDKILIRIIESINVEKLKIIKTFTIYTYDPLNMFIWKDLRLLKSDIVELIQNKLNFNLSDKISDNFFLIETSRLFVRPEDDSLYPYRFRRDNLIGSLETIKRYGVFLFNILYDTIKKHSNEIQVRMSPYGYSRYENYSFIKYLSILESFEIHNKFKSESKDFRIGTVSSFGNIYGQDEYLIDIPYKHYYGDINDYIIKNELETIFYHNKDRSNPFIKNQWVYYNYIHSDCNRLFINSIDLSNGFNETSNINEALVKWLPLLHSSIYYSSEDAWKRETVYEKNQKVGKNYHLLFFITELAIQSTNFKGIINFTLFKEGHNRLAKDCLSQIVDEVYELLFPILKTKVSEMVLPVINKELSKQSTKSAISQVMARNMSHNMGSHVLSKVISSEAIRELTKIGGVEKTRGYKPKDWVIIPEDRMDAKGELAPGYIQRIALFNSYLRNRMDYLADIATGEPAMEVTRGFCGSVLMEMFRNKIMLDRISGVDNFDFNIDVKDCRHCEANCSGDKCSDVSPIYDIPLSIPNDVYGNHALFIILENLIRNTAKHGGGDKPVNFTLRVKEPVKNNESVYEVLLYDDIPLTNRISLPDDDDGKKIIGILNTDIPDWEKKYLDSERKIKKIDWLVFEQNDRLNQSVLDEKTNSLRHGSWGLIEMDVSAGYLRKIPPADIDSHDYDISHHPDSATVNKLNILKAVNVNDCLGYRFHLMKPKEMLIIDEINLFSFNINQKTKLEEHGILLLSKEQFDKEKIYPHPFCLVIAGEGFNLENFYFNPKLPTRLLVCKNDVNSSDSNTRHLVYLSTSDSLISAIEARRFERTEGEFDSIMDLAWRLWLLNKVELFKISDFNPTYFSKLLGFKRSPKNIFNIHIDDHTVEKDNLENNYYEVSRSVNKMVAEKIFTRDGDTTEQLRFLDGVFTRIVIFDERVQKAADEPYSIGYQTNIRELLEKVNVIVPDAQKDIDLNAWTFDSTYLEKMKSVVARAKEGEKNNPIKGVDFVVIHLGVIEKTLAARNQTKKSIEVKNFIDELNPEKDFRVVITSGRGKPENLPHEIPYIGFSILSQFCIENRFKTFLNQTIQSSRIVK